MRAVARCLVPGAELCVGCAHHVERLRLLYERARGGNAGETPPLLLGTGERQRQDSGNPLQKRQITRAEVARLMIDADENAQSLAASDNRHDGIGANRPDTRNASGASVYWMAGGVVADLWFERAQRHRSGELEGGAQAPEAFHHVALDAIMRHTLQRKAVLRCRRETKHATEINLWQRMPDACDGGSANVCEVAPFDDESSDEYRGSARPPARQRSDPVHQSCVIPDSWPQTNLSR